MSKALPPPVTLGTIAAQLRLNLPPARDEPGDDGLSDELIEAVLESAARFATEQLAPLNATGDADPPRLVGGTVRMSPPHRQAWRDYAAAGWLSLDMDPHWGGQGLPVLLAVAVQEIFDRACPAFGMLAVPIRSAARLLQAYAPAEVQADWLPALAAGTSGATICISEVGAGSDVMRLRTHARHDGTGWRISGEKQWISFGDHDLTDRIGHCLLARTAGRKGLSLFLVPTSRTGDTNGVTVRRLEEKLGLHLSPTCALGFEESAGILLGEEERGLAQMFVMIANMRLSVGAMGLGIASAAADTARLYAGERRQGGRNPAATPIRDHPDVQRQLLRSAADVEMLRGLLYATAACADRARDAADATGRADAAALLELLLPLVKTSGGETGFAVASEAIQTLGGAGYTQEWPVEQSLRDARVLTIFEGTTGIQALDILHRRLWRDEGRGLTLLVTLCEAEIAALPEDGAVDLRRMVAALAEARNWLMAHRAEPRIAEASATAFLDLVGLVARGWQAARLANLPGDDAAHATLRALGAHWLRGRGIQAEALAVEIGNGQHLLDAFAAAGL